MGAEGDSSKLLRVEDPWGLSVPPSPLSYGFHGELSVGEERERERGKKGSLDGANLQSD